MQSYPQSANWCFTINNPVATDYAQLTAYGPTAKYLIYSDEVGDTGTPHIQGFLIFSKRVRRTTVKAILPRAHLEASKGTAAQASEYCRGGGNTGKPLSANVVVFGQLPNVPGTTNLYESFRNWVLEQPIKPSAALVAYKYPSLFLRNGRTQVFIDAIYPTAAAVGAACRPYQQGLADILDQPPNPRKIIFVVDPVGNSGKSWFANNYFRSHPEFTQILSIGKRDDLAFAIDERNHVFFIDLPRSTSEYLQYSILEQLKDGRVFSTKYESRVKWLVNDAHVIVLMNEYPDMTKLSQDRYELIVWNNEN